MEKERYDKHKRAIGITIAIQKEGQATTKEIKERLVEWELITQKVQERSIRNEIEKLCAKSLISKAYIQDEDNKPVEAFKMSNPIWKSIPPTAHFKDIVDKPELRMLLAVLDEDKGVNKDRNFTGEYKDFNVVFKVIKGYVMSFWNTGKNDSNNKTLYHYRGKDQHLNGMEEMIVFKPSQFRAWVRNNLSKVNTKRSKWNRWDLDLIGWDWGTVELGRNKPFMISASILAGEKYGGQSQGRGITQYECLPEGTLIKTNFYFPTIINNKEFTIDNIKEFFNGICMGGFGGRASDTSRNLKLVEIKKID